VSPEVFRGEVFPEVLGDVFCSWKLEGCCLVADYLIPCCIILGDRLPNPEGLVPLLPLRPIPENLGEFENILEVGLGGEAF
jgi:hypothetical protein